MNRTLRLLLLILLLASPSYAQTIPDWEIFGGYSFQRSNVRKYFRTTPIIYSVRNEGANLNGFDVSVTENLNPWFAGTLDISGHFAKPEISGVKTQQRMYTVMYGPRFSYRPMSNWIPYGHVLFGAAHMDARVTPTGPRLSDWSVALAAGGGFDKRFTNKTAIRIIQAEYLRANSLGSNQNNFRFSAGFILYVGE